jgi:sugar phosphate isomerase/epimerase
MTVLSLAHLTALDAEPGELFDAAVAGGFDAVGLRVFTQPGSLLKTQIAGDRQVIERLNAKRAATGIRVLDIEAFALRPEVDRDHFLRGLEAGAALGADRLLSVGWDEERGRFLENLGWLADAAAGFGLRVGLEFLPYAVIRTAAQALDAIRALDHPNVGLLVDSLHLSRSGGSPQDLAGVEPGTFAYAQISDARAAHPDFAGLPAEARTDRLAPGEGSLWLDDLLEVLPAALPLSVEAPVKALSGLPPVERGRLIGQATRAYLAGKPRGTKTASVTSSSPSGVAQ